MSRGEDLIPEAVVHRYVRVEADTLRGLEQKWKSFQQDQRKLNVGITFASIDEFAADLMVRAFQRVEARDYLVNFSIDTQNQKNKPSEHTELLDLPLPKAVFGKMLDFFHDRLRLEVPNFPLAKLLEWAVRNL